MTLAADLLDQLKGCAMQLPPNEVSLLAALAGMWIDVKPRAEQLQLLVFERHTREHSKGQFGPTSV